jgi:hypothetical protein
MSLRCLLFGHKWRQIAEHNFDGAEPTSYTVLITGCVRCCRIEAEAQEWHDGEYVGSPSGGPRIMREITAVVRHRARLAGLLPVVPWWLSTLCITVIVIFVFTLLRDVTNMVLDMTATPDPAGTEVELADFCYDCGGTGLGGAQPCTDACEGFREWCEEHAMRMIPSMLRAPGWD